jgi:hypothetical protein
MLPTALIMSIDDDEVLRPICLIHGAQSQDIRVTDLVHALRTTCLKREEADRQTSSLGSVDGQTTRSHMAAGATAEDCHQLWGVSTVTPLTTRPAIVNC